MLTSEDEHLFLHGVLALQTRFKFCERAIEGYEGTMESQALLEAIRDDGTLEQRDLAEALLEAGEDFFAELKQRFADAKDIVKNG